LRTLASITLVFLALNSLPGETRASDDARVMHTASYDFHRPATAKTPLRRGMRPSCQQNHALLAHRLVIPTPTIF